MNNPDTPTTVTDQEVLGAASTVLSQLLPFVAAQVERDEPGEKWSLAVGFLQAVQVVCHHADPLKAEMLSQMIASMAMDPHAPVIKGESEEEIHRKIAEAQGMLDELLNRDEEIE